MPVESPAPRNLYPISQQSWNYRLIGVGKIISPTIRTWFLFHSENNNELPCACQSMHVCSFLILSLSLTAFAIPNSHKRIQIFQPGLRWFCKGRRAWSDCRVGKEGERGLWDPLGHVGSDKLSAGQQGPWEGCRHRMPQGGLGTFGNSEEINPSEVREGSALLIPPHTRWVLKNS